jgi:hypothetical protein
MVDKSKESRKNREELKALSTPLVKLELTVTA